MTRLRRLAAFALPALVLGTSPSVLVAQPAGPPYHTNLQIHGLDSSGATTSISTYSFGDWAGPWWVTDEDPAVAVKDPMIAVAFETVIVSGGSPVRQSHFAILRHSAAGHFDITQNEPVGPADSEIFFLEILKDGGGSVTGLDVYQGSDPTGEVTIRHYTWDVPTQSFLYDPPDSTDTLPSPARSPSSDDLKFGVAPVFTGFDVTTNTSIPASSRLRLSAADAPEILTVEADPASGAYATTLGVVLVASHPAATIRYTATMDGSTPPDPDVTSSLFGTDGPDPDAQPDPLYLIPRTATTTTWRLKFKAWLGAEESLVEAETYEIDASVFADSDSDGLPDIWEVAHGFDPLSPDARRDTDGDGWSDFDELRLGSDPADPNSRGAEERRLRLSGSVHRPDGVAVAGSQVFTISPGGSDLLSDPNHGAPVDPNDPAAGSVDAHAVTDPNGSFSGARTLGESSVILRAADPNAPRVIAHRFVPDFSWTLPPRSFSDPGFFSDPNVLLDPNRLADPDTWFDQYRLNLRYDLSVPGLVVDARSSAMVKVLEHEIESILPDLVLDHTGFAVEMDRNDPPLVNFPGSEDLDLDGDGELDGDRNHAPFASFPDPNDVDLDGDGGFDGFLLTLGRVGTGLTGARESILEAHGSSRSLLGATLQEAAADPNNPTYAEWIDLAEDVFRAVGDAGCSSFFGTTTDVLGDLLDGFPPDPNTIGACLSDLPSPPGHGARVGWASGGSGLPGSESLPADLSALVSAVRAAADTTSAVYSRVRARGETSIYERGDPFATGAAYRELVAALVAALAGNLGALGDVTAGAEQAARAVAEARLLAASGRVNAVRNLRLGIGIIASALDAANGAPTDLANLGGRMNALVYRIDRAAGDPNALAMLAGSVLQYLEPDVDPPVVTASPVYPLFTGSVSVSLSSDEPATILYTLDGSDPAPGGASTFVALNEVSGILITQDTVLSWSAEDTPWGNDTGISRVTYLSDADGDQIADAADNCPGAANPLQENFDGDAMGDLCDPDDDNDTFLDIADCRPMDMTLWAPPDELPITLSVIQDGTVSWSTLAALAGPATLYDLIRGPLGDLRGSPSGDEFDTSTCSSNDAFALTLNDPDTLPSGEGFYYVVRGENACGTGLYGRLSTGAERVSPACP